MRVIVIDDEKAMHLIMKKLLAKLPSIEVIACFQDTSSASSFIEEHEVHMAFVDISMPKETGIQFAERMADRHPELHIVFVTSHKEYAMDAFDLFALDYIVKPVSLERIQKTVNRAMAIHRFAETPKEDKATNRIEIYALGGLEIRSAAGSVKWMSGKSKELFGYLLLQRGRMVSRAKIVCDVFGEMPQKNAETYLNTAIYQLRKALEPHGMKSKIVSDNDGYGFDAANASIDFAEFEEKLKRWTAIDISRLDQLLEIENLYAGDLFGEKAYGWALSDMERLSVMYAGYVKKLGAVLLEHREYGTAVRLLNKLLSRNEFDEETVQFLLGAYAAQKDKAAFTNLFKRYGKMLRRELGIDPPQGLVMRYARLQSEFDGI